MLIKFPSLFTSNTLPIGWDTLGHYYALLKGVSLLHHGELRGYMLNWFGGMPIFYFYPPLAFWLMSVVSLIFPHFSLALIFKAFLLLSLATVTPAFHFFAKSFLPEKKLNVFISLGVGLAYLFYQPFEYGSLGIGVAGAVPVGLIMTPIATSVALVFLGYFKKLLTSNKKVLSSELLWTIVLGTLIIYLHILSMVFVAFFSALLFFFYFKKENIKKVILLFFSLLLTGIYALYPLFFYLGFSSGWRVDSLAYFHDPALPLLAFDFSNLLRGDIFSFNWLWFFIFIFFLVGIINLLRKKHFILPTLFFVSFILIPRDLVSRIFPTLSIHYYRIMPFILFIYLAMAVFGIQEIFTYLFQKKFGLTRYFFFSAIAAILVLQIYSFSFLNSGMNIKPRVIDSYLQPIQYYENLSDYPLEGKARETIKYFFDNKVKSRVITAAEGRRSEIELGSAHYFDTLLPMVSGTPVTFGLYAESAYQAPFLFPAVEMMTSLRFAYGNIFALFTDEKYMAQPQEVAVKELGLFNADYLILDSRYKRESATSTNSTLERVDTNRDTSPFEIYKNKAGVRGYISSPKYLPALYIDQDKKLSFRDFALGWYKMEDVLDFPVIFDGKNIKDVNKDNLGRISFIIVHSNKLSQSDLDALQSLGKKIVVLSEGKYRGVNLPSEVTLINNFVPNSGYYGGVLPSKPNYDSISKLEDIFKEMKASSVNAQEKDQANLKASVWQDENIAFSGEGPIIINASYFPDWHSKNKNQEVYQVTPGQMLVFADGDASLEFSASSGEKVSAWVSLLSIISLIFTALFFKRKRKLKK